MDKQTAMLRVINGSMIELLELPSGIPHTLEELKLSVKQLCNITEEINLHYLHPDFDEFFSLKSTAAIKNKSTIKIELEQTPVVLNLFPVPLSGSYAESTSTELSDAPAYSSDTQEDSQEEILEDSQAEIQEDSQEDTQDSESPDASTSTTLAKKPWPTEFMIPKFSVETEAVLERANEDYRKHGKLLDYSKIASDILAKLADLIYSHTAYPSRIQKRSVADALIKAHPCLQDVVSETGYGGWVIKINNKMINHRTKMRGFGMPDVTCNTLKHKSPEDGKPAKNVKKPRKAEVNFLPPYPANEDEHSLEKEREELITECKKKHNEKTVKEKMNKTFPLRRHEVINAQPSVQVLMERWPAMFAPSQVSYQCHFNPC